VEHGLAESLKQSMAGSGLSAAQQGTHPSIPKEKEKGKRPWIKKILVAPALILSKRK